MESSMTYVHLRTGHYSKQIPTVRVLCWDNCFLGTWYLVQGAFCHQLGPHQTLRGHTLCIRALVNLRVFWDFKKVVCLQKLVLK